MRSSYTRTIGEAVLELCEGDITELDVDAIVNPANSSLILGGGVAGSIARKGGPSIQEECSRIGRISVGNAAITGGGNLRASHVIHAVGPIWGEGEEDDKLASATRNSLEVAACHNLESMALPAISTGIFSFPTERAARIILTVTSDFLKNRQSSLRKVIICLYGNENFTTFERVMCALLPSQAR